MEREIEESTLIVEFLENVLDKSVINETPLSVRELEEYDLNVYGLCDMNILKEYFVETEEFIFAAYFQKKIEQIE